MNYTYIIKCADSTLYTGWTNDLDKRIKAHNSGKGAPQGARKKIVSTDFSDTDDSLSKIKSIFYLECLSVYIFFASAINADNAKINNNAVTTIFTLPVNIPPT